MSATHPGDGLGTAWLPRLVGTLLAVDLTLGALYLANAGVGKPSWFITRLLDLDGEGNLPTWYSSSQLLLLGVLLGAFVMVGTDWRATRAWELMALPLLCVALSIDEVAQVHEWLGDKSDMLFATGNRAESWLPRTGLWFLILGLPFVLLVARLWHGFMPSLRERPRVVRRLLAGFVIYTGSAVGLEALSNLVTSGSALSTIQIAAEEVGEMLGVTLLVWAAGDLLAIHRLRWTTAKIGADEWPSARTI